MLPEAWGTAVAWIGGDAPGRDKGTPSTRGLAQWKQGAPQPHIVFPGYNLLSSGKGRGSPCHLLLTK
jgi:hypothetical protein